MIQLHNQSMNMQYELPSELRLKFSQLLKENRQI